LRHRAVPFGSRSQSVRTWRALSDLPDLPDRDHHFVADAEIGRRNGADEKGLARAH
jgi:hypothetical protein